MPREKNIEIRNHIENIKSMYYEDNKSSYEIADTFGVSRGFITSIMKEAGCKLRPGGNRKGYKSPMKGKINYSIRGSKNGNWKGGVTPLNQKLRNCIEYREWIKGVFERDNYICQFCNKRGGDLQADHYPKSFIDIRDDNHITSYEDAQKCDELWNIDNGRTLCVKCHRKTFIYKGNQYS